LNPVKIFISGPPASGKSLVSSDLGVYYNIPVIEVSNIVSMAMEFAKNSEEEGY
jgi:adenylate kinase family enzyme